MHLCSCATLLCGAAALAQTYQETVYLKNGSIIKGTVLEQEAGGNGHLEFTVGYQKGSVLKKFNDVRYTRSSPEFSVRYYHTLGFGAKAFDRVNLPEILK